MQPSQQPGVGDGGEGQAAGGQSQSAALSTPPTVVVMMSW
jgi:hypothetical protein